jgi:hypothetical protein
MTVASFAGRYGNSAPPSPVCGISYSRIKGMNAVAVGAAAAALMALVAWHRRNRVVMPRRRLQLRTLPSCELPVEFSIEHFFDLAACEARGDCAEHVLYLQRARDVVSALDGLHDHVISCIEAAHAQIQRNPQEWCVEDACQRCASSIRGVATVSLQLVPRRAAFSPERIIVATEEPKAGSKQHPVHGIIVRAGAHVKGGSFDVSGGSIVLGEDSVVEAGALICGPAAIGARCVVRHGAYIRGDVALGAGSVAGGELKHMLALDGCELPHYGYVGDSLLGYKAHLGCGALTANFPLFRSTVLAVEVDGITYDLGRRKFGAVIGDFSQLGCGSVSEPGCLIAPNTSTYPLCRLPRGCYGPGEILKNRPCIERAPLRP